MDQVSKDFIKIHFKDLLDRCGKESGKKVVGYLHFYNPPLQIMGRPENAVAAIRVNIDGSIYDYNCCIHARTGEVTNVPAIHSHDLFKQQ